MITKNIKSSCLLFLIFIVGCSDNPVSVINTSLNADFKIKYGETAYITDENLFITFEDVEEGRCPTGMECFWQGTAKIKLLIRLGSEQKIDTVQTYLPQSIVSIGEVNNSYLFWVKKLDPYPNINQEIIKKEYVLTLNISRFTYGFPDSEIKNRTGIFGQVYITGGPALRIGHIDHYPFQTKLKIVNNKSDTVMVSTDSMGRFIDYTSADNFKIFSTNEKIFPQIIGDTITCTVNTGKMTFREITLDNGIK